MARREARNRLQAVVFAVLMVAAAVAIPRAAAQAPAQPAPPATAAADDGAAYRQAIADWRAARETRLRAEDGWLTVAGLFWLTEGAHRLGGAEDDELHLPAAVPAHAATLELREQRVSYKLAPGVQGATLDGAPAPASGELRADSEGKPSLLAFGSVTLHVIRRGERVGVRVKDRDAAARRDFKGLDWYPVDPSWRVSARFVAHPEPVHVRVPNVIGQVLDMPSPGDVVFTVDGREVRLTPVLEDDGAEELFFIFKDATSGKDTYPAGRFLYAPLPQDGRVTLDFNKAYSPPCAFTPFATCPLPPERNRLTVAVTAGEKVQGHH